MSLQKNKRRRLLYLALSMMLLIVFLISVRYGAVALTMDEIASAIKKGITGNHDLTLNERILLQIRLPRAILCVIVGSSLAVGGVLLQALFRNPIVEPGLIGTSSGAAFGAALYFVLGSIWKWNTGEWTLPVAACAGGIAATLLVYILAQGRHTGKSSTQSLLLTGVAINALFLSGVGFLSYTARDPQARSITFWNLGTLSGANWHAVVIVGITATICMLGVIGFSKGLNALTMGEDEAMLLGTNMRRLKMTVLLLNVIMIAVATAFTGVISFVGLIVPHLLRMLGGSDNRYLILSSVLLGGVLLTIADIIARLALRPAELPIGIVTSLIGVPVFIILLRRRNYYF